MDHVDDLKYAKDRYVELADGDLADWTFEQNENGDYAASGSCPACKGAADGPRLAEIEPPERGLPPEDVDVACECHCEFDHGGGEESGCGRWWIASYRIGT